MNFSDRIKKALGRWIPQSRVTRWNRRYDPPAVAQMLDVDEVHSILRDAEVGNTSRLFALYRDMIASDAHLQAEFSKRKLAVLGDPMTLMPATSDPADANAAKVLTELLNRYDGLVDAQSFLMDGVLWPVACVEKVFKRSSMPGMAYEIDELVPVPYELLDYIEGRLKFWDTDPVTQTRRGTKHEFDDSSYIAHRGHMLSLPDWWGGPMRSLIFWWLMSVMDRDWWARFLERFGTPFLVGKYPQSDDESRTILNEAFQSASRIFGLAVSTETQIELQQAATATTGEAFERFHQICQREKSKLLVGQTLSSEAQSTGLGSGTSNSQERVRGDIRQWDALRLGMTLRAGLIKPLMIFNGIAGQPPMPTWTSDDPAQAAGMGELLSKVTSSGFRPTDAAISTISQRLGFPVERSAPVVAPLPMHTLALAGGVATALEQGNDAASSIARAGAAPLSRAFCGSFAPIRHVILSSSSPEEVAARVKALYLGWEPGRVSGMIEDALVAFAANGVEAYAAKA